MSTVYMCVAFGSDGVAEFRIPQFYATCPEKKYHAFSLEKQAVNYARKRGLHVLKIDVGVDGDTVNTEWVPVHVEISSGKT